MVASSVRINALDSFGTRVTSRTDPIKAMEAAGGLFGLRKYFVLWAGMVSLHTLVRLPGK